MLPQSLSLHRLKENRYIGFALFLFGRFQKFHLNQTAASLTYTTLLALVPFLTIALVVIRAFPMFADLSAQFNRFIGTVLLPEGVISVQGYLQEFAGKAGNLTAMGIIALGISAILLMMTIERTFNTIWQVGRPRPLLFRLVMYWSVITLGPLCIGLMSSLWAFAFKPSAFFADFPLVSGILYSATSVMIHALLLALLFCVVPYRYVPVNHALIGGLITAAAFECVRHGFAVYVRHFNSYELIYGAFMAVPLFLLWLFLLWCILLGGAVLTAGLSHWQNEAFRRYDSGTSAGRLNDVVQILALLHYAHQEGKSLKIQDFRKKINLGYDTLGEMLDQIEAEDLIAKSDNGWILKTDARQIMLDDLFLRFVYRPAENGGSAAADAMQEIFTPVLAHMDISLADFLDGAELPSAPKAQEEKNFQAA